MEPAQGSQKPTRSICHRASIAMLAETDHWIRKHIGSKADVATGAASSGMIWPPLTEQVSMTVILLGSVIVSFVCLIAPPAVRMLTSSRRTKHLTKARAVGFG
jgi:hypothetical protein